jgi:hypothetical protein
MINIRIIFFFLLGTVFFFLLLRYQGKLETKESPLGIVSLELARNPTQVKEIINSWSNNDLIGNAKTNVWIDFLLIPFYSLLFYTLCGSISVRTGGQIAKIGVMLAFASVIAGLLDVMENMLMLLTLNGVFNYFTVILTSFFAASKFILLALALLYVIPFGIRLISLKILNGRD